MLIPIRQLVENRPGRVARITIAVLTPLAIIVALLTSHKGAAGVAVLLAFLFGTLSFAAPVMCAQERARWETKRLQGRTRFVCRYTFVYGPLFGLLLSLGMYLIHRYFYPQRLQAFHFYFAVGVPVWIVLSCIGGMFEWRKQERRFRGGQDARGASSFGRGRPPPS